MGEDPSNLKTHPFKKIKFTFYFFPTKKALFIRKLNLMFNFANLRSWMDDSWKRNNSVVTFRI